MTTDIESAFPTTTFESVEFIGCGAYRRDGAAGMRQDSLRAAQPA